MITLEGGRGVECMMPRRLAQPCPLSLYSLSAHAVVYLNTAVITFEVDRGVELYDAAASGTAMPSPPLLAACTRCRVLGSSCWIRYQLLFLVAVLSVRCRGVWRGSARSLV